jgi:hypothetical protein
MVPTVSQTETWPVLVFCHRMSESPSPLKSPVPIAFQLGPGLGLTAPTPVRVVPFISQIEALPMLVFCHRMSEVSPLKNAPVPTTFQLGPGLGFTAPPPAR